MLINDLLQFNPVISDIEFALEKHAPLNWEFTCTSKTYHALVYVIDGYAQYIYNDTTKIATPGSVLYLAMNSSYRTVSFSDTPYHYIIIAFHCANDDALPFDTISKPTHTQRIFELFSHIAKVHITKELGFKLYSHGLTEQLIYYLFREYLVSNNITARMHSVISYIEAHYNEKISIETLSELVAFSPSHFRKVFKDTYGTRPIDYINYYRIEKAKELLKSELYTQKEIASLCGFENINYFHRVFKKHTGVSPGKW